MFEKTAENKRREEEIEYIKDKTLRKFPLLGVTMSRLKTSAVDNLRDVDGKLMGTTTTDGKVIYYHPEFFESLSDDEKIFIFAHEVMHVAFNHIVRSKDRDQKLWSVATDSVINQILKNEGLPLVKGSVNREEAISRSAEEMYEKLLQERGKEYQEKQENNDNSSFDSESEEAGHDNHEIWKEVVKQMEQQSSQDNGKEEEENSDSSGDGDENEKTGYDSHEMRKKQKQQNVDENERQQIGGEAKGTYQSEREQDEKINPQSDSDFERSFANENRKERESRAGKIKNSLDKQKNQIMAKLAQEGGHSLGSVGTSESALDWKKVLKKSLEDEEHRWSYRRANAENDYMARVEEIEDEELAETEVMLDVSGSVDVELLKEFLRQLKPILKTSRLKVGCFDEYFYGLKEVRSNADIDNFKIISKSKWTENWDLAVKSFSKRKEINKIVFTDGYPAPGTMPDESTKNINVIWVVYGNKKFNPICGKVIQVDLA